MPRRTSGDRWNCEACGKPLVGALTGTGRVAPIEVEASDGGTVLLHKVAGVVSAWTLGGTMLEAARTAGVELRLNHFASCPQAGRFRP